MEAGSPIVSGADALDGFIRAAAEAPRRGGARLRHRRDHLPHRPHSRRRARAGGLSGAPRRADGAPRAGRLRHRPRARGRPPHDPARGRGLRRHARARDDDPRRPASRVDPQAERYVPLIHDVAESAARDLDCEALGVVHRGQAHRRSPSTTAWRADAAATRHEILTRVIEPARERGLAIATGHFAFEVRPPLPFTKGSAVRRLLAAGDYLSAIGCGDDLTDITMFAALRDWGERDARRRTVAVAAVTDETPRPVLEAADVLVRATPGDPRGARAAGQGRRRRLTVRPRRRPERRDGGGARRFSAPRTPAPASRGTRPCPPSGPRSRTPARRGPSRSPARSRCRCRRPR